jgi:hypothetical protein
VFQRDAFTSGPKLMGYKHVDSLVHVDERGNCLVDPSPIERIFVRSFKTSFSDHSMERYETALTNCVRQQQQLGAEALAKESEAEEGRDTFRENVDLHPILFRSDSSQRKLRAEHGK